MKLISFEEDNFKQYFTEFLQEYRKGKSIDRNLEKAFWDCFRAGFKMGRNEVLDIFGDLNKGFQSERI